MVYYDNKEEMFTEIKMATDCQELIRALLLATGIGRGHAGIVCDIMYDLDAIIDNLPSNATAEDMWRAIPTSLFDKPLDAPVLDALNQIDEYKDILTKTGNLNPESIKKLYIDRGKTITDAMPVLDEETGLTLAEFQDEYLRLEKELKSVKRKYKQEFDSYVAELKNEMYNVTIPGTKGITLDHLYKMIQQKDNENSLGWYLKSLYDHCRAISEPIANNHPHISDVVKKIVSIVEVRDKFKGRLYDSVQDELLQRSAISMVEANEWALKNCFVDKNIPNDIEIRMHISNLYMLTNGALGPVHAIKTYDRAHANQDCIVNIGCRRGSKDIFHECGHLMENYNRAAIIANKDYIEKRATGKAVWLGKLIEGASYNKNETALPDKHPSEYVGKIYPDGTEVLSMGMEYLATQDGLAKLATDKEYFQLIMGYCLSDHRHMKEVAASDLARLEAEQLQRQQQQQSNIPAKNMTPAQLKKYWEKELRRVCTRGLKAGFLRGIGGYRYVISPYDSYECALYKYDQDADKYKNIAMCRIHYVTRVLYLAVALENGDLPDLQLQNTGWDIMDLIDIIKNNKVPEGFNSSTILPEIV